MTDISNTSTKISRYTYLDMYKRYRAWTDKNHTEPIKEDGVIEEPIEKIVEEMDGKMETKTIQ